ncbi:hypothetical protein HYT53_03535 [Candidatus Woesearchaeota archaeon]|nr:hypothetical protein [Candidatus Woesearchaeota archaeon]
MALKIGKSDISKVANAAGAIGGIAGSGSPEQSFWNGLNTGLANFNSTIREAKELWAQIKETNKYLQGKTQKQQSGSVTMKQVEPAERPQTPIDAEFKEIPKEDKRAKAEAIFKEFHEGIKPYIPNLKEMTAAQAISLLLKADITAMKGDEMLQIALNPETKQKIIAYLASKI